MIKGSNYAQIEALYDILLYIHICRISLVAYSDGAECIAEVGMAFRMWKTAEKLKKRGFVDENSI